MNITGKRRKANRVSTGFYGGVPGADPALMQQTASSGQGEELFASSNTAKKCTAGLMAISGQLSGERPVAWIQ